VNVVSPVHCRVELEEEMLTHTLRRNLFAVFAVGVLGCGGPAAHPDEAAAVIAIQKLGGKVEYEGQDADRRVIKVYLHNTAVQDSDLMALEKLPKLRNLFLGKTQIGDPGLEHLQKSGELQTLSLNSTRVTDAGLKSLAELKKLKTLNVKETQVTNAGAAQLKKAIPGATIAR
jgi:hypothetical protein